MKKFFYFLLFLVIVSLGILLYFFLSSKGVVPPAPFLGENPFGVFNDVKQPPLTPIKKPSSVSSSTQASHQNEEKEVFFEKIWNEPVAGYSFVDYQTIDTSTSTSKNTTISSSTSLFFVERATGHIYKKGVFDKKDAIKLSNTTIAGVYDAYFFDNNTRVLMRYLRESDNTIVSLTAKLPPLSVSVTLPLQAVTTLENNIVSVAVSPDQKTLSYLVKTTSGSDLYEIKGDKRTKIRSYDLSELTLLYKGQTLFVSQKPTAFEKTYFFQHDKTQAFGGRTGQKIIFSQTKNSDIYLSSYFSAVGIQTYTDSLTASKTKSFSSVTLVDKCTSSQIDSYFVCGVPKVIPIQSFGFPDDWYRGLATFNDTLTLLNTKYYTETTISNLEEETGEEMDIIKLTTNANDSFLAFTNKKNNTLWVAKLSRLATRN